jgi:hypothetical protein
MTQILHLPCQSASDLNRWLIAKVLLRGLRKDFSIGIGAFLGVGYTLKS